MKTATRMEYKAARVRSRLVELTFGTFNVRTAVVNGVNGIGNIDTLRRPFASRGCEVTGLQETKPTGFPRSWHLDIVSFSVVIAVGSKAENNMGLGG